MKKATLMTYSMSGNTGAAAELVEEALTGAGIAVQRHAVGSEEGELPDWDYLVIGAPLYFQIEPLVVRRAIEKLPSGAGKSGFLFSTYADTRGGRPDFRMVSNLTELLSRKGIGIIGSAGLVCDDSSDILVRTRNQSDRPYAADTVRFTKEVEALSRSLAAGSATAGPPEASFRPRRKRLYRKNPITWAACPPIRVDESACNRCGLCVKTCPARNLAMEGRLSIGADCMKCYACENACPRKAIRPDWRFLEWLYRLPPKYEKTGARARFRYH
jgi:ferredoxin/flavodoxin